MIGLLSERQIRDREAQWAFQRAEREATHAAYIAATRAAIARSTELLQRVEAGRSADYDIRSLPASRAR